jgi:hypothetical protein
LQNFAFDRFCRMEFVPIRLALRTSERMVYSAEWRVRAVILVYAPAATFPA